MHDIRAIRENPEAFAAALERRGNLDVGTLVLSIRKTDDELRALLTDLQQKQARRNEASKQIGQAKARKDEAQANALMAEVAGLKDAIQQGEQKQRDLEADLRNQLAVIPNIPADDVPQGADENANVPVEARHYKAARNAAGGMNNPKEHFELGEALRMMDFERAAKVSGARFVYLKSQLARLNRALASLMLDTHTTKFGYEEVVPPFLARDAAFFGTGQLPKFEFDQFWALSGEEFLPYSQEEMRELENSTDTFGIQAAAVTVQRKLRKNRFGLVPTAEVPLTNYVADEILNEAELPIRFTAYTPCFRAEAGAAGKDTRGMIRMHQFDKVELVSITTPEQSNAEHERMTDAAQEILKRLDIAHRVVTLCTGDMGFSARKTYDIEVWLPGQNRFREISSCSNCGDFQARRMNARYRGQDGKVKGPVHTLNGSGLAIGRTLIAVMENYQNPDGSIAIPDALKLYMGGLEKIERA
ncbi:MAG: serine--tRNA ligase [Alphaproteobacteria bacterium]|nr:serine--tRNA ligase [Alphaproteobacteria bacterium]MBL6939926.1 serine--tRNA ligase [Alphaproteobacteria bacterium]MBL7099844.1 serine--tRNA ligase [Alphaproteobacteria bacterium]